MKIPGFSTPKVATPTTTTAQTPASNSNKSNLIGRIAVGALAAQAVINGCKSLKNTWTNRASAATKMDIAKQAGFGATYVATGAVALWAAAKK